MHTSFADQLAGLDLAGFSVGPAPLSTSDFPVREAVVQTLEAVWSDLFAMVSGTALEADAEDLGWAFVNIFHRSAERKSTALDRATDMAALHPGARRKLGLHFVPEERLGRGAVPTLGLAHNLLLTRNEALSGDNPGV